MEYNFKKVKLMIKILILLNIILRDIYRKIVFKTWQSTKTFGTDFTLSSIKKIILTHYTYVKIFIKNIVSTKNTIKIFFLNSHNSISTLRSYRCQHSKDKILFPVDDFPFFRLTNWKKWERKGKVDV